ncbi:hypothetical protein D3C72_739710 [compost metagenome]
MPRYSLNKRPPSRISWPGLSLVRAKSKPSMTASAPAAIAFTRSPENCSPPSAMSGTPCLRQASAAHWMAVICGTPAPATTRVVQIEPGPTPTLTPSAPATMSASAALAVATLPATTSTVG